MSVDQASTEMDLFLARRLQALRQENGLSLDELAEKSGVSRATLSRLERGETSPSTFVLNRICTVYQRTVSSLLAEVEGDSPLLIRRAGQSIRIDPETGYARRILSPPSTRRRGEMIEAEVPFGPPIAYETAPVFGLEHYVVVLEGELEIRLGGEVFRLGPGDCLTYRLHGPCSYQALSRPAARYIIAFSRP